MMVEKELIIIIIIIIIIKIMIIIVYVGEGGSLQHECFVSEEMDL